MKTIIIGKPRKDGKFPVTYIYQGAPNMFGGHDHPSRYSKLHTAHDIGTSTIYPGDTLSNNSGLLDSYFFGDQEQKEND
tara:strand:+ start:527 stop:763 length:237 start_codon:yes stop_codon:yes gene_type:complete